MNSILTGREAPPRAQRTPEPPPPTDLQVALDEFRGIADGLKASGAENLQALHAAAERALAEAATARETLQRELDGAHAARSASETTLSARLDEALAARVDLERQLAETRGLLAAAEANLLFERQRPPAVPPKVATADFVMDVVRGADGKIINVKMRHEPRS
jgi:hypothetical protein